MNKKKFDSDLKKDDYIFIDTRSPGEFEEDHIPGAMNIPIFDNMERKEIGTLYKDDKEGAFELGLEYYSKKLPGLVSEFKDKLPKDKKVIVYCWRGGMRSKAITQMVDLIGYDAFQLDGGYKAYREFIREELYNYKPNFRFIVLWGHTGTGKTRILQKLNERGMPIIDLEGLAQHRSSLFGAVGLKPVSQKTFETNLYFELEALKNEKYVFVEGESRKIGDAITPDCIYDHAKNGINVSIVGSIEKRSELTVDEYFEEGNLEGIREVIPKLKQKLGGAVVEEMLELMDEKKHYEVAKILLEKYYDPLYAHTIDNKEYEYEVNSDDQDKCVDELIEILKKLD